MNTLEQKPNFYPEIPLYLMFEICEFCEKLDFEIVNCVKNVTLKMWILSKIRFWKCEFCEKWDFEIVNFVKKKMWFWKCQFCKNEIFKMFKFLDKLRIFAPVCGGYVKTHV